MTGPLPVNSQVLRHRRYEAWVGRPIGNGRYEMIDEGRFASLDDAKAWVAGTYPHAETVRFTYLSEVDNWQPHRVTA